MIATKDGESSRFDELRRSLDQLRRRSLVMRLEACERVEKTLAARVDIQTQVLRLASKGFAQRYVMSILTKILDAAMEGTNAGMGNIQLCCGSCEQLQIRVQRGFQRPFL